MEPSSSNIKKIPDISRNEAPKFDPHIFLIFPSSKNKKSSPKNVSYISGNETL